MTLREAEVLSNDLATEILAVQRPDLPVGITNGALLPTRIATDDIGSVSYRASHAPNQHQLVSGLSAASAMFASKTRKNFLFYLTFHVARYAFPLIVTPFLAHYLMKDGFGQYAVINSCVWSTVIFMDFGFYMYGINRIAHVETMDEVSREASAVVSAKLTLMPLCLLAYTILAASSGMLVRNPIATAIGALLAVGIGADFSWYFQGRQRGGTAVMIAGIPQLGQLALYLLLVRSPADLWLVILIQALTSISSLTLSILLAQREGMRLRIKLWNPQVRVALSGAKPFFVERLCFSFYTALTPTIIAMLVGIQEAATYSLADRVNIFLGSLAVPISQTMLPVLTRQAKHDGSSWKASFTITIYTVMFCGAASGLAYFTIGVIIRTFFSQAYEAAIPTAQIFCLAAFVSSITLALSNFVIIPRGAANILILSASIALFVSLLLQFTLVPIYGASGGAYSRLGAEMVTASILSVRAAMLYRSSKKTTLEAALQNVT
jgi:polysaccharide transporter, PST family